jgi:hypothetical protein
MGRHILFKCPHTGLHVQHWLPSRSEDEPDSKYAAVICPACTRVHFIDGTSGKLLNDDK